MAIVKSTYLLSTPEITRQRINTLVQELATAKNKFPSEIALEAIGKESLSSARTAAEFVRPEDPTERSCVHAQPRKRQGAGGIA